MTAEPKPESNEEEGIIWYASDVAKYTGLSIAQVKRAFESGELQTHRFPPIKTQRTLKLCVHKWLEKCFDVKFK